VRKGDEMIRVGVIGYGYWGPNVVRNFSEAPGAQVVAVSDLLANPQIGAIAICTPVSSHFEAVLIQPVHKEPFYRASCRNLSLPATEQAARSTLFLPIFPGLTEAQQERIIAVLKESLARRC